MLRMTEPEDRGPQGCLALGGVHLQRVAVGEDQHDGAALGGHVDVGREQLPRRPRVEVLPHVAAHRAGFEHDAQLSRHLDLRPMTPRRTQLSEPPLPAPGRDGTTSVGTGARVLCIAQTASADSIDD